MVNGSMDPPCCPSLGRGDGGEAMASLCETRNIYANARVSLAHGGAWGLTGRSRSRLGLAADNRAQ